MEGPSKYFMKKNKVKIKKKYIYVKPLEFFILKEIFTTLLKLGLYIIKDVRKKKKQEGRGVHMC